MGVAGQFDVVDLRPGGGALCLSSEAAAGCGPASPKLFGGANSRHAFGLRAPACSLGVLAGRVPGSVSSGLLAGLPVTVLAGLLASRRSDHCKENCCTDRREKREK